VTQETSEKNTARLIHAAYDSSARPTTEAKEQVFRLLLNHMRAPAAVEDFPTLVVGLLGGMLAIAIAWLVARVAWIGPSLYIDPTLLAVGVWAFVNLSAVPVAGIVILKRRKNYG
jgi:hypothetical protein